MICRITHCTSSIEHFWKIPLLNVKFSLNGSEIEIVKEFNYLRILLNRTNNFHKAITKQAEKAKKAMYELSKRGPTQ